MLSSAQLRFIMPGADASRWLPLLNRIMTDYAISSSIRISAFLAQVAVESAETRVLVECMNYSAGRLMEVWPTMFPAAEVAGPYAHNPEKLANLVYANRLGNGVPASGDGFRYRGRGLLQTTGKDNYRAAGRALHIDLVESPELLEQPLWAAAEAGSRWQRDGLNELADKCDLRAITLRINGALGSYADRVGYWRRGLKIFEAMQPGSAVASLARRVQGALNARATEIHLTEDGIWGPLSDAAAERFRAEAGLQPARGIDSALLHALELV